MNMKMNCEIMLLCSNFMSNCNGDIYVKLSGNTFNLWKN